MVSASSAPAGNDLRDRVLTRLVALLSLTQDMKRNDEDDAFAQDDEHEILYCIDPGIIEGFLKPSEKPAMFETFHGREWTTNWRAVAANWNSISAQSTLIGTDYLLTGRLPGQRQHRLYMSEWHYREFFSRYRLHREEIETHLNDADALEEGRQQFLRAASALDLSDCDSVNDKIEHVISTSQSTPMLREDVARLKETGISDDVVLRFCLSRATAALLSSDIKLVQAQRLRKFYSPRVAGRISPLHALFRPSDADDRDKIQSWGAEWFARLLDERDRRSAAQGRADKRSNSSLKNDARTLAYLTWISRTRLKDHQRIVLVSGSDDLLINAYRSWHVDQPIGEPFLVRRATQYAQVINLNAAPNDIENARPLFHQTRSAVEVTLAPLNMAAPIEGYDRKVANAPPSLREYYIDNNRLYLAWMLAYVDNPSETASLSHFLSAFTTSWVDNRLELFGKLREDWQEFERFTIGASYDQLRESLREILEAQELLGELTNQEKARESFVAYLGELLEDITKRSIRVWFPLAKDFVRATPQRAFFKKRAKSRVPIALQLRTPAKSGSRYDLVDVIEHWIAAGENTDDDLNSIVWWTWGGRDQARPDLLFAVAATLALRLGFWADADFFADLARMSAAPSTQGQQSNNRQEENYHEYLYLGALAKRFRLGQLDLKSDQIHQSLWRKELDAIVGETDRSEAFHRSHGDDIRHRLRTVRSMSERAAARIFFSTWAVVGESTLSTTGARFSGWPEVLQSAHGDLSMALQTLDDLQSIKAQPADVGETLNRLEKQVVANVAAAYVLSWLCRFLSKSLSERVAVSGGVICRAESGINRLSLLETMSTDMPSATQVDVLTFKHIHGGEKNKSIIRNIIKSREAPRLPVDEALFSLIMERI